MYLNACIYILNLPIQLFSNLKVVRENRGLFGTGFYLCDKHCQEEKLPVTVKEHVSTGC